jgi:hypothetical protein
VLMGCLPILSGKNSHKASEVLQSWSWHVGNQSGKFQGFH